ncbi:hypothetical protein WJX72_009977 [[Myrmecia] bisecta]|uniref:Uncharacterized protein n=1 Tax=[Myrmecia] bisecta TaxID=41462 RepID=A0AAW1QA24_9CHLO
MATFDKNALFDDDSEGEGLDAELQRVLDGFDSGHTGPVPQTARTEEQAFVALHSPREVFATSTTLESSISYLRSTLATFGFPDNLHLQSPTPQQVADSCNILYALLQQRQKDIEARKESQEQLARLGSNVHASELANERLQNRLAAKERELGVTLNKAKHIKEAYDSGMARLTAERDDLQRVVTDLSRRHVQFQHEIKRKEREFERLQDKLRDMLTEKKREAKANMEATTAILQGQTPAGKAVRKTDEAMYKAIVSAYEAKQKDLLAENRDMKAALHNLQAEHRRVVNRQTTQVKQLAAARHLVEEEFVAEMSRMDQEQLKAALSSKMAALKQRVNTLSHDGVPLEEVETEKERRLHDELKAAKAVMQDQEALVSASLAALALQQGGASSTELQRLDEDYKQRLQAVQRKLDEAQNTAETDKQAALTLLNKQMEQERQSLTRQIQEDQRKVAEAKQLLDRKKEQVERIAQEQRTKLQLEARQLETARREFENTQAAHQEALRKYAPGFGAGTFLASAVAKQAARDAEERNAQLSTQGDAYDARALEELSLNGREAEPVVMGAKKLASPLRH